jgi:hypothetical protein
MKQPQRIPDRLRTITEGPLTEEKWEDFEDLLDEIKTKDNTLLPEVLESFACVDNDVALIDCQWELIHHIEAFETNAYLHALVEKTPFLWEHAPQSLHLLWIRILNSPKHHACLKQAIFPVHDIQHVRAYLLVEPDLAERVGDLFS